MEAAREGGKPLIDSEIEVARALDGVKNCIEILRTDSGTEIPMNLNASSEGRLAITQKEPIGVVVAVSATGVNRDSIYAVPGLGFSDSDSPALTLNMCPCRFLNSVAMPPDSRTA